MRQIRTSGLMSGEGRRAHFEASPRPSSTLQIKGIKRHVLVDTVGLLLHAVVHPADVQDRNGGILVMATLFGMYPFLQKLFARCRLSGVGILHRSGQGSPASDGGDRQTFRSHERICSLAK